MDSYSKLQAAKIVFNCFCIFTFILNRTKLSCFESSRVKIRRILSFANHFSDSNLIMRELMNSTEVTTDDYSSFASYRCRLILRMCSSPCIQKTFCCSDTVTQCDTENITCCKTHLPWIAPTKAWTMSTDQVTSDPGHSDTEPFDNNENFLRMFYYGTSTILFLVFIVIVYQCFKSACLSASETSTPLPVQSPIETAVATAREPLIESSLQFEAPPPGYRYEGVRTELMSKFEDPPPPYVEVVRGIY